MENDVIGQLNSSTVNPFNMQEFCKLTPKNYTRYLPMDVVALDFNLGKFEFKILTRELCTYELSLQDNWNLEELISICDLFGNFNLDELEDEMNDDWRSYKIGNGEWLIYDYDIYDKLPLYYINCEDIRNNWVNIVCKALDPNNHMKYERPF